MTSKCGNGLRTLQGNFDTHDKLVSVHGSCRLRLDTGRDICSLLCASTLHHKIMVMHKN